MGQIQNNLFTDNCRKNLDLHRKIMCRIPFPWVGVGVGINVQKCLLLRIKWNVQICTKSHVSNTFSHGLDVKYPFFCQGLHEVSRSVQENHKFKNCVYKIINKAEDLSLQSSNESSHSEQWHEFFPERLGPNSLKHFCWCGMYSRDTYHPW